jgi:prohibitin 2
LVDQAIQEKQVFSLSFFCAPSLICLKSIIVRAQGEARSAELIGESMRTNKGFLELRRLEAAREIANLLAGSGNRVMLDSQSLLLNGMLIHFCQCLYFIFFHAVTGDDAKEILKVKK